jgi:hypothetical protein
LFFFQPEMLPGHQTYLGVQRFLLAPSIPPQKFKVIGLFWYPAGGHFIHLISIPGESSQQQKKGLQ